MGSVVSTQPALSKANAVLNPLVRVRGISKRFPVERDALGRPTHWLSAVDDISLDIFPGETLGLIGESGSGKSTLGRLILRLLAPSSGSVQFEAVEILNVSARQLRAFRHKPQIIFHVPFDSLHPRLS